jgi:hypothetical protein
VVTISCNKSALALGYTNAIIINQKESDLVMVIIIKSKGSIGIKWWWCKVGEISLPLL